jgi:hypothetical protein
MSGEVNNLVERTPHIFPFDNLDLEQKVLLERIHGNPKGLVEEKEKGVKLSPYKKEEEAHRKMMH